MWIIERDLLGVRDYINGFSAYNIEDKKHLEDICNKLNKETSDKASYKIIKLENQFVCECCNKIYYDKHRSLDECECGALTCEFCQDAGECVCNEDYNYIEKDDFHEDFDIFNN